jgi:hypothetical protein
MPATNATLPGQWFEGEPVQLWITSIAPYFCKNNGAPGDDFSNDSVWIGVSTGGWGTPTTKTTGLKYAVQYGDTGGSDPKFDDSLGNPVVWTSIDDPSGPYYQAGTADGNWALQTSYDVTTARYDLPFGPYQLNLTTDNTPYPAADGDIIVVTTGSTVLAGAINEGPAYSVNDTRSFNLIFYSTGSANVNDLVQKIPENAAPGINTQLTSYNGISRYNFVVNSGGLFAFVAIPSAANPSQVMWWPITWDDSGASSPPFIRSFNAS